MTSTSDDQRPMTNDQRAIPAGYWQREASHYPKPLTPLGSSLFIEAARQSFPKVFAEFGLLAEALELREINGYVYTAIKPFRVGDRGGGQLPPKWLLWLVLRLHPAFRRRIADNKRAMSDRLDLKLLDRWDNEWRPSVIAGIARLRVVDLPSLSDDALAQHVEDVRRFLFHSSDVHFYLTGGNGFPIARLVWFCRDRLGHDTMDTLKLMSGLSGASSEPALRLAELATLIKSDATLTQTVQAAPASDVRALLLAHGGPVASQFEAYVHDYGFRALRYEVVEPTLAEQPQLLGRLLQDQLARPNDLRIEQDQLARERADAKAAALGELPDEALRSRFLTLLAEAERAYPVREDNEFYTISVPLALCRLAAQEAAKRLVAADAIAVPTDVFYLRCDEVLDALRTHREYAELVADRRAAMRAAEAFDPPPSYGVEPPQPPLDILPAEMREAMEAMIWMQETVFDSAQSQTRAEAGATEIRGRAAARGTYTGTARVIMGEHDFNKLQPDDVLVCPMTSPVWSILFAKVGALVTDTGGILSHPAIIAREYGIPAVVATGNATELIHDGQQILVDGDAGVVRILT
jgi:phosphohistidine swiveling domain-containing protein